ncbi:hypothetical protein [Jeotgalicoccus meleagridis]|uniref:Uncharacterized protein n=1 Tax=Jeotgalicoccus meleagridis TaxID=2759181 RepID=A0A6V7RHS7_9STAP|nr:hypothetical protein [Jeotgalicoccus meleagridis]CAD2077368.1 hypothetical protein JEODO184_01136 [Jeotgalicoccus meleagridis]HIW37537.1 hypothetical protein [Candidatus Jeotgalicoccus stercoravium]
MVKVFSIVLIILSIASLINVFMTFSDSLLMAIVYLVAAIILFIAGRNLYKATSNSK